MGTDRREAEKRLRRDVESALRRALDPSDVLPMLHRLARTAAPGSEERVFAHRQLAELLAEKSPWRAAIYAKRVIAERPDDDRGWALLGLSQTLLGHYRFAVSAYQRALVCAPRNPWYAHNLGHLLDVALDRAGEALEWLRSACCEVADLGSSASGDIAASFAHALARAGKVREAKAVLVRAIATTKGEASREHAALLQWLERGAPAAEDAGRASVERGARRARRRAVTGRSPALRQARRRLRPERGAACAACSVCTCGERAPARGDEAGARRLADRAEYGVPQARGERGPHSGVGAPSTRRQAARARP